MVRERRGPEGVADHPQRAHGPARQIAQGPEVLELQLHSLDVRGVAVREDDLDQAPQVEAVALFAEHGHRLGLVADLASYEPEHLVGAQVTGGALDMRVLGKVAALEPLPHALDAVVASEQVHPDGTLVRMALDVAQDMAHQHSLPLGQAVVGEHDHVQGAGTVHDLFSLHEFLYNLY